MITKSDWQSANQQLMADERRRLEPPTAEEMLAYMRGELSEEEEKRIQERLACHPELVRTLTAEFPEAAQPGDPDYVTDAEYAGHWKALQARIKRAPKEARVLQFWRWSAGVAAGLAVVASAAWWQATDKISQPRVVTEQWVLSPDGRRGGGAKVVTLTGRGESVLLTVPLIGPQDYTRYRLELIEARTKRAVWKSGALEPADDDTFVILAPRRFFDPGVYQVEVYGINGATEEPLATYSLLVPRRP
jgi:hypothetical protein